MPNVFLNKVYEAQIGIEDKDIIEKDKLSEYRDGYAKE